MAAAHKLFDQFQASVNKHDLAAAKRQLLALKLKLSELGALPLPELDPGKQQDLLLTREVLEYAVFLSVRAQDEAAFERNFQQLKPYYTDTRGFVPASSNENLLTGLNLLRLLVQNRIAEFHTELELIPVQAQQTPYIQHATQLERYLMEGVYGKVLALRNDMPDPSYGHFMERLLTTVRDEIAGCSERAYNGLSVADAKKLLMLSSDQEVLAYAKERGWKANGKALLFQHQEEVPQQVPSMELIGNLLTYARELERIV